MIVTTLQHCFVLVFFFIPLRISLKQRMLKMVPYRHVIVYGNWKSINQTFWL